MHVEKFSFNQAREIVKHCKRDRPPEAKYGNENIVQEYTYLNTEFTSFKTKDPLKRARLKGFAECVKQWKEISEKATGRKTAKTAQLLVSVIITLPEKYRCPEGVDRERWYTPERMARENEFFTAALSFLRRRFGLLVKQPDGEIITNFCYAVVHRDETSPHLHAGFIPVLREEKRYQKKTRDGGTREIVCKRRSISACEVINREILRDLHPQLDEYVREKVEWYKGGLVLSDEERARKLVNVSMKELKATPEGFRDGVLHPQVVMEKMEKSIKRNRDRGGRD